MTAIGGAELSSRTPYLMGDYAKEFLPQNPGSPAEHFFDLELLQLQYQTKQDGNPILIARYRVVASTCHLDPVGVERSVLIHGTFAQNKGGLDAFFGRIKAMIYPLFGLGPDAPPEQIGAMNRIIDRLFNEHLLDANAACGARIHAVGRPNGEFVNFQWSVIQGFEWGHLPARLREITERLLAGG